MPFASFCDSLWGYYTPTPPCEGVTPSRSHTIAERETTSCRAREKAPRQCPDLPSFGDVLELDAHSFGDGITHRLSMTPPDTTLSNSTWSRSDVHLFGASPSTTFLFRRRNHAPLTQTCTAGVYARSCKSRREMRPRKPDETLSRHGRRARRVAFLSPRAMFSLFCSPLDYLYARFKLYQNDEKFIPHFRRIVPYSEWGRNTRREGGGTILPCQRTTPRSHLRARRFLRSYFPSS